MKGLDVSTRKNILKDFTTEKGLTTRKLAKRYNVCHTTIENTIKRFGESLTVKDMPGRGRKPGPCDPEIDTKVCRLFSKCPALSIRDAAKKLGCTSSMVKRVKDRNGLKSYRKRKVPKRSVEQEGRAKSRAKLLTKKLRHFSGCIVMDDETYVKLDYRSLLGTQFYTAMKGQVLSKEMTTIPQEKFGRKR